MRPSSIILIFWLVSFELIGSGFSDSVRLENDGGKYYVIHQIDPGETLYSLSKRYKTEIDAIRTTNSIQGNELEVGQVLRIPYDQKSDGTSNQVEIEDGFHEVAQGETLFSISKLYDVSVDDIKSWNGLSTNELFIGQLLKVKRDATGRQMAFKESISPKYTYYVRTGESLAAIAKKFEVPEDSIISWNKLNKRRLTPGQALIFPFELPDDTIEKVTSVARYKDTSYGSKMRSSEEGGVARIVEEGIAKRIDEDLNTTKYLALHRNLRIGTVFQVKNLMNNERIYVRVVGKLPDTGINKNVMIRLTPVSFEKLGILDDKALVEITYFKQ